MTDSWHSMLVCDYCLIVDFFSYIFVPTYNSVQSGMFYPTMADGCLCVLIRRYVPLCVHPAWRQWWRKAQTPMMHLSSLFCCVRAACGFVCLSILSARCLRGKVSLSFPFLLSRPLLLFHSLPSGTDVHSFTPHSVTYCHDPSFLICNETVLRLRVLSCTWPLFLKMWNQSALFLYCGFHTPLCSLGQHPSVRTLSPLWWSYFVSFFVLLLPARCLWSFTCSLLFTFASYSHSCLFPFAL